MTAALDVSAVVCSLNVEQSIGDCLKSLQENRVGEIILVDADSKDRTREIAKPYVDEILTDPRKGLAMARNIGIRRSKCRYVLNVGADNIMPPGSIEKMIRFMQEKGYSGVSALTEMHDPGMSYFSWAMNQYKRARYFPGERTVIGTPTLFEADLLKTFPYDDKMSWSDDADLCDRLSKQGHKFAIADVTVNELGSESLKSIRYRWKGYGRSDWEIFRKWSPQWSLGRRLWSLTHPWRNEFWAPLWRIPGGARLKALPFLALITGIRYGYWIKFSVFGEKK